MVAVSGDAPLTAPAGSDTASAVKYFLDDLDRAIVTTAIGIFSKLPEIYTKLCPFATVVQQQTAREP